MNRKPKVQACCLILLLLAETIQGLTPDLASLSSTKLVQMVRFLGKYGSAWTIGFMGNYHDLVPDETTLPRSGSAPSGDDEADEVCLASFTSASQLAGHARENARAQITFSFVLTRAPIPSRCRVTSDFAQLVAGNHSIIHALCRLTC
jgi:hypothetical protein